MIAQHDELAVIHSDTQQSKYSRSDNSLIRSLQSDDKEHVVFCLRLVEQLVLFGVGGLLFFQPASLWLKCVGVFITGFALARNLEIAHECIHQIPFKRRSMNLLFGTLLVIPLFINFEEWRRNHLHHHSDVKNRGFHLSLSRIKTIANLACHLVWIPHYREVFPCLLRSLLPTRPDSCDRLVKNNNRLILFAIALILTISISAQSYGIFLLWIAALVPAAIIDFHIQIPEHHECNTHASDSLMNSRSVTTGSLIGWAVYFNNFHAEHHWAASVPFRKLHCVRSHLGTRLTNRNVSYSACFRSFYGTLFEHVRQNNRR